MCSLVIFYCSSRTVDCVVSGRDRVSEHLQGGGCLRVALFFEENTLWCVASRAVLFLLQSFLLLISGRILTRDRVSVVIEHLQGGGCLRVALFLRTLSSLICPVSACGKLVRVENCSQCTFYLDFRSH